MLEVLDTFSFVASFEGEVDGMNDRPAGATSQTRSGVKCQLLRHQLEPTAFRGCGVTSAMRHVPTPLRA